MLRSMYAFLPMRPLTRPFRVAHFVSTFAVKTDTKWLVQLARHLDPREFQSAAVCFHEGGPIQAQLNDIGVRTENIDVAGEHDPRAIFRARDFIESFEADIVHTHLLRADLFAGLAARWAAAPVLVSTCYAMGAFRREKKRRSDRILDAICAALPTHTIAVSKAVATDCIDRLHMRPDSLSVIHTGIEPPEGDFSGEGAALRSAWGEGRGPIVLTIARLSYEKGVDTLIDAAASLQATHPDVRFVVLGDGDDRAALQKQIDTLGLSHVVRLAGFVENVYPALAAADVVCLPSKSEGMPNVLLEAMAMRKPIVATDVGGIPEAIISEVNGLLVPSQQPDALARGLARTLDDREAARRWADAAHETMTSRFHADIVARQYAALYRRLIMDRRKTRGFVAEAS
ncbi:MAG: hypothetical protein AMXMBFR20_04680 [Planctomycetia bacterium]